jgi:hypothetical protein
MINRRAFLCGLIAAPAIVRIDNIMPVRALQPQIWRILYKGIPITEIDWAKEWEQVARYALPDALPGLKYWQRYPTWPLFPLE